MAETLAGQLARWCCRVEWSDLPSDQRYLIRLRILDTLGLILAAVDSPQGRSARTFVQRQGGVPESTLIGTGQKLPAAWTALYHATLAHSHDFDDTFLDSVIHPGSVIVPVALAVSEATAAPGEDLMLAIAIGYEVAARLGAAAGRQFHARGLHATGIVGPLAGALTAARLYRLSPSVTTHALGLAGSMSSGLLEFLSDGSWSKWFHCGWAAHGGIVAAQLGGFDFSGPSSVLEGAHGLYNALLGPQVADFGDVTVKLGQDWRGGGARFKHYPCAHVIHPFIDAALRLRAEHRLEPENIVEVRCTIAPWCVPLVCEPREQRLRPRTSLQAIASLPYLVAAVLVRGDVTLQTVATPERQDPAVYAVAERVRHIEDARSRNGFEGWLEIETADGRTLIAPAVLPQQDDALIRAKFRHNAASAWDAGDIEALENAVFADVLEPARIFSLLSSCGPTQGPRAGNGH